MAPQLCIFNFQRDSIPALKFVQVRVLEAGRIRALVPDDIPRVAELYWQFLQGQRGVVGFLGIVPRPISLNGKTIQAAFGSSLVVYPRADRPRLRSRQRQGAYF